MTEPIWITYTDSVAVHEMMLAKFGGLSGIGDIGLLYSALDRPKNLFLYENATIPDMAASLASGIVLTYPFNDGNKRTGFLLAAIFVESNGYQFIASEELVVQKTLALAARDIGEKEYTEWLADSITLNT